MLEFFVETLLIILCEQIFDFDIEIPDYFILVHHENLADLDRLSHVEGQDLVLPNGRGFLGVLLLRSFQNFLADHHSHFAVHVAEGARLPPDRSSLEPEGKRLGVFLFELGNEVDIASILAVVVDEAPELVPRFLELDDRIQVDNPETDLIIRAHFFLVHEGDFQIPAVDLVAAVDAEGEGLVEHGLLVSLGNHFGRFLLVGELDNYIGVELEHAGISFDEGVQDSDFERAGDGGNLRRKVRLALVASTAHY